MEDETPTFAKENLKNMKFYNGNGNEKSKKNKIKNKTESKLNKRHSHSKTKHAHHHEHHYHKKRHHSEQFNLKNIGDIQENIENRLIIKSNVFPKFYYCHLESQNKNWIKLIIKNTKEKYSKKILDNYCDFMKKQKFILRNDFDKKHVEKFLSSKEKAFEKPFLFSVEAKDNKDMIMGSNFTLQ